MSHLSDLDGDGYYDDAAGYYDDPYAYSDVGGYGGATAYGDVGGLGGPGGYAGEPWGYGESAYPDLYDYTSFIDEPMPLFNAWSDDTWSEGQYAAADLMVCPLRVTPSAFLACSRR